MMAVGLLLLGGGALLVWAGLTGQRLLDQLRSILTGKPGTVTP